MKTLRNWIIVSWIAGITILYYRYHLFYLEALQSHSLWLGAALIIAIAFGAAWFIRRKSGISLSYLSTIGLLIAITTLMAVVVCAMRGMLTEVSVMALVMKTAGMLIALFATLTLVFGICTSCGLFILKRLHIETTSLTLHALAVALGILILQLLLFGLGLLGALNIFGVLGALVAMLFISLPEATILLQASYRSYFRISWDIRSITPYIGCTAVIVFALNLLHILRPIPNGWDEYVRYLNTPRILANTHELFTGINPYPNELMMSIGFMLRDSLFIALGFSVIMGALSAIGVYALARHFLSEKYSALAASLWYLIPFVVFQSSREVKIDLAVAFFTVTALIAVVAWFRDQAQHTRSLQWLTVAGLLAGASFASKYTALFFIIALASGVVYGLIKVRRQIIIPLVVFALTATVAYLPWAIYFVTSADTVTTVTLQRGAFTAPQASCVAPAVSATPPSTLLEQTGTQEELGRYLGYAGGIKQYLLLPWTMTMNPIVRGLNVDSGPLFLALLPILLWFTPIETTRTRRLLTIYTVVYWALWVLLGKGVIWYGLPGFATLILFLVWPYEGNKLPITIRRVSLGLIALSVAIAGLFRVYSAIPPVHITYLSGAVTTGQYIDSILPKYREMYELINSVPATVATPNYVYRIGTFIPYFIRDNHRRLYTDDQMDMLSCIREGRTDAETIMELKAQGFRFIVFDLNIPTIDQTEDKTLTSKWKSTADFINNNLKILSIEQEGRNKIVLAELP